jgi:type III secretory pathway component EscS
LPLYLSLLRRYLAHHLHHFTARAHSLCLYASLPMHAAVVAAAVTPVLISVVAAAAVTTT